MNAVKTILAAASVVVSIICVQAEKIKEGDTCAAVIEKLAFMDEKFSQRPDQKKHSVVDKNTGKLIGVLPTNDEEVSTKANGAVTRDGIAPMCGATADWVIDVFRGTAFDTDPQTRQTADSLKNLFQVTATKLKGSHIVYHAALLGANANHAFVVEQTPVAGKDPEYRIYQSYIGAYSLAAWLSPNDPTKLATRDEHIYLNHLTRCGVPKDADLPADCKIDPAMNKAREGYSQMKAAKGQMIKDWVASFEKKTKADAKTAFEKAWKAYGGGKGRRLTKAEFMDAKDSFLMKLVKLLPFFEAPETEIVTPAVMELHEEIFGAPLFFAIQNQPKKLLMDCDPEKPGKLLMDDFVMKRTAEEQKKHCVAEGRKIGGPTA